MRTQHRNFSVTSADLGQCYDAVGHGITSMALQAFGVPINAITLMLTTLQLMNFWLLTAYGESEVPFGGNIEKPCYGLGQGAGSAPPSYSALSTLSVGVYKD